MQNYRNRRPRHWHKEPTQQGKGIYVEVRNGDVNAALRKFKKKVQESGVLQEYRERQEYVKPSEKRKREKAAGKARWLKKENKMKQDMGL